MIAAITARFSLCRRVILKFKALSSRPFPLHHFAVRMKLQTDRTAMPMTKNGLSSNAENNSPWAKANPARVAPQLGHGMPTTLRNVHAGNSLNTGARKRAKINPNNKNGKRITPASNGRAAGAGACRPVFFNGERFINGHTGSRLIQPAD